ncbi:MAG: hypothetical protein ACO20H_10810 [Bacteriovoracaceae bacterium]
MKSLLGTLTNKWKQESLPHFIILKGHEGEESLREFTDSLLLSWLEADINADLQRGRELLRLGHPDILRIDTDEKQYYWSKAQNNFKEYNSFKEHSPLELRLKVVIISKVHLLTDAIMNKLLKDLEDNKQTLYLFMHHTNSVLLPTIQSRAITLNVPRKSSRPTTTLYENMDTVIDSQQNKTHIDNTLKKFLKNQEGEYDILEELKKGKISEQDLYEYLLSIERDSQKSYLHKDLILKEIQHFSDSKTYNNPAKERFYQILNALRS